MTGSRNQWEEGRVRINGVLWVPDSVGLMNAEHTSKVEITDVPGAQTIRVGLSDPESLHPEASPEWGTVIERKGGKFAFDITAKELVGVITLVIYSPEVIESLALTCEVKKNEPVLRLYYESTSQDAPLPPEVTSIGLNSWSGFGARLKRSDGAPVPDVQITVHMPEKETYTRKTGAQGTTLSEAFRYDTVGPRTIEATADLPSGNLSVQYLIDVK